MIQQESHLSKVQEVFIQWRALAVLGAPILVAQLAQMANGVIDTLMAGNYGAVDLAGVGIGCALWTPLFLFFIGCLSALQPTISGHCGARRWDQVLPVLWQGIYIGIVGGIVMIVALLNSEFVLLLLDLDAQTARVAQGYLSAFAFGIPAMMIGATLRGLTDGIGFTRLYMLSSLLGTLLNLPLNYIFIYGALGAPELGGVGCGWATAIANWLSLLALLAYLRVKKIQITQPQTKNAGDNIAKPIAINLFQNAAFAGWVKPDPKLIVSLLRLGVPIGLTIFIEVSMFSVIALFLAPLGPIVIAGHQIVLNVVSLLFMVPLSLGMSLTLRVSYLVGAKQLHLADLLAKSSLLLAASIAFVYAPLLYFGRDLIATLYTNDPAVIAVAQSLIIYGAIFQFADVIQITAISALRGYHDTRVPMFIILFSFWVIGLPLGYVLTFTNYLTDTAQGAVGFWIGLTIGLASASIFLTWRLFLFQRRLAAGVSAV